MANWDATKHNPEDGGNATLLPSDLSEAEAPCVTPSGRVGVHACEDEQQQHVRIGSDGVDASGRNRVRSETGVQREAREEQSPSEAQEVHQRALGHTGR